jgi:hypothetical protein
MNAGHISDFPFLAHFYFPNPKKRRKGGREEEREERRKEGIEGRKEGQTEWQSGDRRKHLQPGSGVTERQKSKAPVHTPKYPRWGGSNALLAEGAEPLVDRDGRFQDFAPSMPSHPLPASFFPT